MTFLILYNYGPHDSHNYPISRLKSLRDCLTELTYNFKVFNSKQIEEFKQLIQFIDDYIVFLKNGRPTLSYSLDADGILVINNNCALAKLQSKLERINGVFLK